MILQLALPHFENSMARTETAVSTCLHLARRCYETQGLLKASHLQQEVGQSACLGKAKAQESGLFWLKLGYHSRTTIMDHNSFLEENTLKTPSHFRVFHEYPSFQKKQKQLKHLNTNPSPLGWEGWKNSWTYPEASTKNNGTIKIRCYERRRETLDITEFADEMSFMREEMNPNTFRCAQKW